MPRFATLVALCFTLFASAARADDPALQLRWHLDQVTSSTPDSSGRNRPGSGTATSVSGKFSGALSGTMAAAASGFPEPAQLTVMAWVRGLSPTLSGERAVIAGYGGINPPSCGASPSKYALQVFPDDSVSFVIQDGASGLAGSPGVPAMQIWDGLWHAVAGVYDGTKARFYLDGTEIGNGTVAGPIPYGGGGPFTVGRSSGTCQTQAYQGDTDEVRLYDRALGPAEIGYLQGSPGGQMPRVLPAVPVGEIVALRHPLDTFTATTTPDVSGNGLDGTGAFTSVAGRFGQATKTLGQGYRIADDARLRPQAFTAMAWVSYDRTTNGDPVFQTVVGKGGQGCSSSSWAIRSTAGGDLDFFANLFSATGGSTFVETGAIARNAVFDGAWHAVAATYEAGTAKLWMDGTLRSTATVPAADAGPGGAEEIDYSRYSEQRAAVGRYPADGCTIGTFPGAIDEVRLYDRVLTDAQIQAIQTANSVPPDPPVPTPTPTPTTTPTPAPAPPSVWWHLDDDPTATTVTDSSGNHHDGTIKGPSVVSRPDGRFGRARAVKDGIGLAAVPALETPTVSVVAWVRGGPTAFSRTLMRYGMPANCSEPAWDLRTTPNGNVRFVAHAASGTVDAGFESSVKLWDGAWHGIGIAYTGQTARLVIDGQLADQLSAAFGDLQYAATSNGLELGDFECTSEARDYDADDFRLYGEALSDADLDYLTSPLHVVPPALPAQELPAQELVARYHLDGPATGIEVDSSGHGLHARGAGASTPGRFAEGRSVDDAFDGFSVPPSTLLQPQALTVLAWVKGSGPRAADRTVVGAADGCGYAWALETAADGGLDFLMHPAYGGPLVRTPPVPPATIWDGQWHAVAGVVDAATITLWVDGAAGDATSFPTDSETKVYYPGDRSRLDFGRDSQCQDSRAFGGAVDEVRLYDRPLTGEEIGYLQNPGFTDPPDLPVGPTPTPTATPEPTATGTPQPTPEAQPEPDLAVKWHLDQREDFAGQPYDAKVFDASGNGHHGDVAEGGFATGGRFGNAFATPDTFTTSLVGVSATQDAAFEPAAVTELLWVRGTEPDGARVVSAYGAPACGVGAYGFVGDTSGLQFVVRTGAVVSSPPVKVFDGQWHAVAGRYDGHDVRIYVDGAEAYNGTAATGAIDYGAAGRRLRIGGPNLVCPNVQSFRGDVDEARIYRRALTVEEIAYLGAGHHRRPPTLPIPADPRSTSRPSLSGTPKVGETLSCNPGTWTGGPDRFEYLWEHAPRATHVDGDSAWVAIDGATGQQYTIGAALASSRLRCREIAFAGVLSGEAVSTSLRVDLDVPAPSGPILVSTEDPSQPPRTGRVLTCERGEWTNGPAADEFTYRWARDGVTIAGATEHTYTPTPSRDDIDFLGGGGDGDHDLSCSVSARNDVGAAPFASSRARFVIDARPIVHGTGVRLNLLLNQGDTPQGNPLQHSYACLNADWDDAYADHPDTTEGDYPFTYQWYRRDGSSAFQRTPIAGATERTLRITADLLGRYITCEVTASNPLGDAKATSPEEFIALPAPTKRGFVQKVSRDNPNDPINLLALDYDYRDYAATYGQANLARQRTAQYSACRRGQQEIGAQLKTSLPKKTYEKLQALLIPDTLPTKRRVGGVISPRETCWILLADFAKTQATSAGVQWDPPDYDCVIGSDAQPCVDIGIGVQPLSAGQRPAGIVEQTFLAKAQAIAPLRVLWDIDGDNQTDISCPGTSPVVRGIFPAAQYDVHAVIVDNSSEQTGLFSGGQLTMRVPNDASRNPGKLRKGQPLWCRASVTPPPDPKVGPCTTTAAVGTVAIVGNLCPINVRAVPTDQIKGLPQKMQDVIATAAAAINALEFEREKLLPGFSPGTRRSLLDSPFRSAGVPETLNATLNNVAGTVAGASAVQAETATGVENAQQARVDDAFSSGKAKTLVTDTPQSALDQIYVAKTQLSSGEASGTSDLAADGGDVRINGVDLRPQPKQTLVVAPSVAGDGITGLKTPEMEIYSPQAKASLGAIPLQSDDDAHELDYHVDESSPKPTLHGDINWDVTDPKVRRALALGPFRLVGRNVYVHLNNDGTATINALADLPGFRDASSGPGSNEPAGRTIRTPITLSGDPSGVLKVADVHLQVKRAYLKGIPLKDLDLYYNADRGLDVTGRLGFELTPDDGIQLQHFRLDNEGEFAGTDLFYDVNGGRGLPVAPGVWLQHLTGSLDVGGDTFEIKAGAAFDIGPQIGKCPIIRSEGGALFHLSPTPIRLGVDGDVKVFCVPIGGASLAVDDTGWVDFSAYHDFNLGIADLRANIRGQLRGAAFKTDLSGALRYDTPLPWSLEFSGMASFDFVPFDVGFSGIFGSRGVAGCASIRIKPLVFPAFTVSGGAGVRFFDGKPPTSQAEFILGFRLFVGCDLGPFRAAPYTRTARQAGAPVAFQLDGGRQAISLEGAGAAPHVRLVSPDGKTYDFTDADRGKNVDDAYGAIVEAEDRTVALLPYAKAGTWRAEATDGSTPIVRVQVAEILPKPAIKARVSGSGRKRVLTYSVKRLPGQEVVFTEGSEGAYQVLGKVKGGGKGKLHFTPAEARSPKRTITAQVTQDGLPRAQPEVAHYVAANPKLAAPKARIRRHGAKAVVTFRRVPGAVRYDVAAAFGDGRRLLLAPSGNAPAVTLPGVGRKGGVSARVTAYTVGGRMSHATARLKPVKRA